MQFRQDWALFKTPIFTALYLEKFSPVTFNSKDATATHQPKLT